MEQNHENAAFGSPLPLGAALFCLSMAIVALELVLMRYLSFVSYHHFSYLVISTGLLGFGVSGTLLTLFGSKLRARFGPACILLAAGFSVSVLLSVWFAQRLPVNFQYALYDRRQAAVLILYHLTFIFPFLLGALVIGLSLSHFTDDAAFLYGANMAGSGAGALAAVGLMFILPEAGLFHVVSFMGLAATAAFSLFSFLSARSMQRNDAAERVSCGARAGAGITACTAFVLLLICVFLPPGDDVDQHKALHEIRQWERQGQASHVLTAHSPRGRIDVYRSPLLRAAPFAGASAWKEGVVPPEQIVILVDGEVLSAVFRVENAGEAEVMDHTLMSLPYRVMDSPRVLLLGEAGGLNVWLARRMGAARITAVHGDPVVYGMMKGPLAGVSGGVLVSGDITAASVSPRLYLERAEGFYDIIHVAAAEGIAAGHGGLMALREDFLMTTEAFALCLRNLAPSGILAITRGIQTPPRDNIKILATAADALKGMGIADPGRHIVQMHNYLGVITLVSREPFAAGRVRRLAEAREYLQLDVDWSPSEDLPPGNHRARLPGPADSEYSYYHHAAGKIFRGRSQSLFNEWIYNIRPATDDSPYFYNFFRWSALPVLRSVYGHDWLRRAEFGYILVAASFVEVSVTGALLILLPLLWLRRGRERGASCRLKLYTLLYFLALGFAFMMTEITFIARLTHFLGDPVLSAGGVLCAFLVFSGLGSAVSGRIFRTRCGAVCFAAAGIIIIGLALLAGLGPFISFGAGWSTPLRLTASIAMLAPLAFCMGMPFPNGLRLFGAAGPELVPWAWGINGFASVAAAPLALMAGMQYGFGTVIVAGLILYAIAAATAVRVSQSIERCS